MAVVETKNVALPAFPCAVTFRDIVEAPESTLGGMAGAILNSTRKGDGWRWHFSAIAPGGDSIVGASHGPFPSLEAATADAIAHGAAIPPATPAPPVGESYEVTGMDCGADGMERLRDQDEFILLAYPESTSTAGSIAAEWCDDIGACGRGGRFRYGHARAVVKAWARDNESAISVEVAQAFTDDAREADECAGPAFRLYVRTLESGE